MPGELSVLCVSLKDSACWQINKPCFTSCVSDCDFVSVPSLALLIWSEIENGSVCISYRVEYLQVLSSVGEFRSLTSTAGNEGGSTQVRETHRQRWQRILKPCLEDSCMLYCTCLCVRLFDDFQVVLTESDLYSLLHRDREDIRSEKDRDKDQTNTSLVERSHTHSPMLCVHSLPSITHSLFMLRFLAPSLIQCRYRTGFVCS